MNHATKPLIKEFGNSASLIVAFALLQTVPEKNFKMSASFGQPFKGDLEKCNVVCNAGGWIAQHPHFKAMGVKFEERTLLGKTAFMPVYKAEGMMEALGYNALAYALEMNGLNCCDLLAPTFYPAEEVTTKAEVLHRFKKFIEKSGGGASLKALLDSQKPLKVKKEKKAKPEKAKKVAKPAKKAAKPAKKVAKKVVKKLAPAPKPAKKAAKKAPAKKK